MRVDIYAPARLEDQEAASVEIGAEERPHALHSNGARLLDVSEKSI